jgi:23S rRNA (cytosine1962-C5)-methyltransferase
VPKIEICKVNLQAENSTFVKKIIEMLYSKIFLKSGKDRSVLNFHPWIFSGAIKSSEGPLNDGEIVDVLATDGRFLGRGFYNNGSITVRIFTFKQEIINANFWREKLQKAYEVRKVLGLIDNPDTNAYRLVHGEGDGIPGLIIDMYNGVAVLQSHNFGAHKIKEDIVAGLKDLFQEKLHAVYDKSSETMPKIDSHPIKNHLLFGSLLKTEVVEHGNKFFVDFVEGQKTGYFIDQRENRKLLAEYSKDKSVLNTFCYSGGFSIYSLTAGATKVHSVDSSKKAIDLTDKNVELNGFGENHQSFVADTFDYLKTSQEKYDVIVLDPPAFAKHLSAVKNASQGYQRLNLMAFQKIKENGVLFTFSCSQAIDKILFRKIVFAAAAQSGRNVRILHQLTQPPDHPISIYHPEGEYLKGLVLHIE